MLGGLVIGVIVAWEWIARESRAAQDQDQALADQERDDG